MTDDIKVKVSAEDEGVVALLTRIAKSLETVTAKQKQSNAASEKGAAAQNALAKSASSLIGHLRGLAIGYAAIRTLNFVKDQVDAADALSKLAQKSGITVETLSALAFAGETADVSIDQLGTSAKLFAKSTADLARGGGDAADAFHSLGLSAKDLQNLSPDAAFLKTLKTLGSYEDGLAKAEVAQKIFGKSGTELIPLANQIAEEGFGSISEAAAKAGRIISGDAGKAAEAFNDQLKTMEAQAKGAAFSFGKEVVPAISDILTALDTLKGAGDQTFLQSLGKGAASALKGTVAIGVAAFKTLGEELGNIATIGTGAFFAIAAAARGDIAEARQHIANVKDAGVELANIGDLAIKNFNATRDALDQAEIARNAKSVAARTQRENTEKRRLILANQKEVDEITKARAEAEEHAREGEGKILAANLALKDQEVEHAFSHGLTALAAYFAARRQTIVEAGAQEIKALKASRDAIAKQPVATPAQRIERADKVAQKNVDIKVAESKITQQLNDLDEQRGTLAVSLAATIADAEAKIRAARGDSSAEAKRSLENDVAEYRKALAQLGTLTDAEQQALVSRFRVTLTLDINAQENQRQVDQLFGDIDRKRTALEQEVSLGLRSQASAQQELANFEAGRLPTLKALADEMERFGLELDNPALQAAAAELQIKLAALGKTAAESSRLAAEMGTDIKNSLEGDLSTFLGSTISQVGSLGEAFKSLASSVVASIQQIIAKLLAAKAVEGIAKLLGGIGGASLPNIDFGGINSSLAGVPIPGFARGGYTGPGGKHQPAGVVHKDEYVFTKEQTRAIGVRRLAALARNPRPVASWAEVAPSAIAPRTVRRRSQGPLPGYADGGLVTAGSSAAQGGEHTIGGAITLHLQDGLVAHAVDLHLRSPDGKQRVLEANIAHKGKLAAALRGA